MITSLQKVHGLPRCLGVLVLVLLLKNKSICVCAKSYIPQPVYWGQRTTCRNQFSPSTLWMSSNSCLQAWQQCLLSLSHIALHLPLQKDSLMCKLTCCALEGKGYVHMCRCVCTCMHLYICMCLANQSKSETHATPSDLPKCLREGRGRVKGIMKFSSCSVRGLATSLRTPVWFCTFLLTALALFVLTGHSWGNGTSSKMECSSYPEGPSLPSSCLCKTCP